MEGLRAYILSVTAASILCAVLTTLAGNKGSISALMKLISAVVLAAVMVAPLVKITSVNLNAYLYDLNAQASEAVNAGTQATNEAIRERIIRSCSAYILDKANAYDLDIEVTVKLDEKEMIPVFAEIRGAVSPAARRALEVILQEDLGIPPEAQVWK